MFGIIRNKRIAGVMIGLTTMTLLGCDPNPDKNEEQSQPSAIIVNVGSQEFEVNADDMPCRVGTSDCLGSPDGNCCVPNVGGACVGSFCGHCSVEQVDGACWQQLVQSATSGP
jgi:hypothetical protein